MANRQNEPKLVELLEKLLTVQLHSMGAAQGTIARVVGKSKSWVNDLLKGVKPLASKRPDSKAR